MKRRGSTEWTPIYMVIVLVIAAILVLTLVTPLIRQAGNVAGSNLEEARTVAKSALFLLR